MSEQTQRVSRVQRVIDVRVVADLSAVTRWIRHNDFERIERALREAADEFNAFIRDHRSQDHVRLDVERTVQDQCSGCGNEWEPDNGACAHCGAEVDA